MAYLNQNFRNYKCETCGFLNIFQSFFFTNGDIYINNKKYINQLQYMHVKT